MKPVYCQRFAASGGSTPNGRSGVQSARCTRPGPRWSLRRTWTGASTRRLGRLALLLGLSVSCAVSAVTTGGFVIDTQDRFLSRAFFNSGYGASAGVATGWTGDLASCTAGTTSAAWRDVVLLRVNWFRAMAGVPASVTLRAEFNTKAQAGALLMSANGALNHFPPASWTCWSQTGYEAAGNSNLSLGYDGPDALVGQMTDNGTSNAAAGHRRWILYPQTQEMGTGDIPQTAQARATNALWVFDGRYSYPRPSTRETYVAWPPPGYVPYQVVYPRWSFSYARADFSSATVTVTRDGAPVTVAKESVVPNIGENTLVWVVEGRDTSGNSDGWTAPSTDLVYDVSLGNVLIDGQMRTFTYRVTVIDPSRAGPGEVVPTVAGPAQVDLGYTADYAFAAVPHAIGYDLGTVTLDAYSRVEGAEPGTLAAIVDGTDADYPLVSAGIAASGGASFHLAHPNAESQFFALSERFLVGAEGILQFKSWLGLATPAQVAKAQASLDGGLTWIDLYTQAGTDSGGQVAFTDHRISLAALAGRVVSLRFFYEFNFGSYYPQTTDGIGFYVDEITVTGVERVATETLQDLGSGTGFTRTASALGRLGYRVRPRLWDGLPALDWAPATTVTVSVAPPQVLSVTKAGSGTGRVLSTPAGIDCGTTCSQSFAATPPVALTASAESGSVFIGWGGSCSGSATCSLSLDQAKTVTAVFTRTDDTSADTDDDHLPDLWELAHGLNPNTPDASLDTDRDGATNLMEYQAGTDPGDPKSIPLWMLMPSRGGWRAILQ